MEEVWSEVLRDIKYFLLIEAAGSGEEDDFDRIQSEASRGARVTRSRNLIQ